MKKISFVVPCYNSEDYMERCIDSLLVGKEDVEIIIVNDGSKDKTGKIADRYQKKYPTIVKAIHKENGGHGSGVNTGIKNATGKYFKVVDSDDWLDKDALIKLLDKINEMESNKNEADLIVCNYVYDHLYENKQRTMSFNNVFKENEICTWNDLGHFKVSQYMIMHSLIYKTKVLKKSKVVLPEHTFYVDNIVAYQPLFSVESIMYLNIDLYHYFIGREDQSVNESVMVGRVNQQIKVTKIIASALNLNEVKKKYKKLYKYLLRNVSMMVTISSIYLLMKGDKESYNKRKELWQYIKGVDKNLAKKLRFRLAGLTYILPGKVGGYITLKGYKLAQKIYKFN
jgi:glycosyltransferase involved in cell wall biosynthesis